jgi:hypothetical protein
MRSMQPFPRSFAHGWEGMLRTSMPGGSVSTALRSCMHTRLSRALLSRLGTTPKPKTPRVRRGVERHRPEPQRLQRLSALQRWRLRRLAQRQPEPALHSGQVARQVLCLTPIAPPRRSTRPIGPIVPGSVSGHMGLVEAISISALPGRSIGGESSATRAPLAMATAGRRPITMVAPQAQRQPWGRWPPTVTAKRDHTVM